MSTKILTGLTEKAHLVGFSHMKPTTKENMYILIALLAFTTILFLTIYIERKLDAKKRERRKRDRLLFLRNNLDNKVEVNGKSRVSLNMQSLDNVI